VQRSKRWIAALVVALVLVARPAPARAGAGGSGREAEAHVAAAIEAYRRGQYERALAELEVGYAIEPRLEFLISFAQVYAAVGRYAEAIDRCERYLDAMPNSRLAPDVERLLRELRAQRDHAEAVRAAAAAGAAQTPLPPAPAAVPRAAVDSPASAAPARATTANERDASRHRRVVWGVVGGVSVVVAGLVLGLGLGLGLRDEAPTTKLGTVSF
jgi:tetratricopeptide (TPR) repeat protein